MLRNLLTRQSEYVHRHAAENRAPSETPCVDCGKTEPGTEEQPVVLAECSVCKVWLCAGCYTMHSAPAGWDDPKPSLWKRLLKVVRRG